MKSIFVLLSLVFVTSAWASPNIGDKAVYTGDAHTNTGHIQMTLTKEVVGFDHQSGMYTVVSSYEDSRGTTSGDSQLLTRGEIISADDGQYIVDSCKDKGWDDWSVRVPAGVFQTCRKAEDQDGYLIYDWIGAVPFGLVHRSESMNGDVLIRWSLLSYVLGDKIHE